jgi:hypothetical protein
VRGLLLASVALAAVIAAPPAYAQSGTSVFAPIVSAPPSAVPSGNFRPWAEAWAGFSFQNNSYGGYWGGNVALNSQRNVWDEGPVLRFEGAAGHYDYGSGVIAVGAVDATYHTGGMFFGYRKKVGDGLLSGYVGVNYQHDDTNDPTAKIQGTKAGVKLIGEYYSSFGPIFDFWGQVAYTTVYDTFTAYARPGMLVAKDLRTGIIKDIRIGPDLAYYQNNVPYRQYQVGAFAQFTLPDAVSNFTIAGGYREPLTSGSPTGYYANIGIYHPFQ